MGDLMGTSLASSGRLVNLRSPRLRQSAGYPLVAVDGGAVKSLPFVPS